MAPESWAILSQKAGNVRWIGRRDCVTKMVLDAIDDKFDTSDQMMTMVFE